MKTQPKPAQWITMGSAIVMLLFSFFSFVKFGSEGRSVWSGDAFFPLTVWPVLFGLIAGGTIAANLFGGVKLPEPLLTFNWRQINFLLAFTSFFILVGFLFVDFGGALDRGIGFWFMLLASIGLVVGTVMDILEVGGGAGTGPSRPSGPATPF